MSPANAARPAAPRAGVAIPGFRPYVGQHCETVATGSLLGTIGVQLSEPMLFGLGQGLGFIFINLSSLPLPFVGGRVKPFALTQTLCANLGLECTALETTSKAKAWSTLESALRDGRPVGLQLDCFHLEYFTKPVHFAGHFVAAYGCDERDVLLVDTQQQGSTQRASRRGVEAARFAKGPMAAKARSWTIAAPKRAPNLESTLRQALPRALRANAADYLSPPFKGASFHGIRKLADSLPDWLSIAKDPAADLALSAMLMEKAGTGGALFRNFFRDFLAEARDHLGAKPALQRAHAAFSESAAEWTEVAALIGAAGRRQDAARLVDAAARCRRIADLEVDGMRALATL
ncbi:MAG TPA: BtrH N-terminal domain-containing protein [Steroidobacteraceae bacterium]|nr:BtrH N-terminal domain-containing protein [Steroidobacteraceae bacterium]